MKVSYELDLAKFEAWSGGKTTLERIIEAGKVEELESTLEELYPDGLTETHLNDMLWFDTEWIYETLGISEEEEEEEE